MQDDCKRQDIWTFLLLTEIRLEVYCILKDSSCITISPAIVYRNIRYIIVMEALKVLMFNLCRESPSA